MKPWPCFTAALALALAGCAQISVRQTAADGRETRLSGVVWFSSAQSLAKLRLTNTDKTQSVGAEDLGQRGATNTVAAIEALTRLLSTLR